MSAIKKTVSIDKNIAEEASALNSNFSAVVEAALVEYIHHHRVQKATHSFGKWEERKESSVDIVNDLRREDSRQFIRSGTATTKNKKVK
jgi:post-segregation antitoxin (ccd killing protein)